MASIPTILIKNSDPEAYNLGTIIQSPRTCTTIDVRQACANLDFVPPGEGLERSALVESFVRYLFTQYFVLAHQSGLYNRQMRLWQVFSKVEKVEFKQVTSGVVSRNFEPAYELAFRTSTNHVVFLALLLESSLTLMPAKERQNKELNLVKDFIARVAKLQVRQSGGVLRGIFIGSPQPGEPTLNYLVKETGGTDPVARFDCYMGSPLQVHVNFIGYSAVAEEQSPEAAEPEAPAENDLMPEHNKSLDFEPVSKDSFAFNLVYPALNKPTR